MYPVEIVQPMKEELTDNGFKELTTGEEVVAQLHEKGTTLVMINSVCGCSAGSARPGVLMAVANASKRPNSDDSFFRFCQLLFFTFPPFQPAKQGSY